MSKVKSFIYYIEYKDGSNETMNKNTLESLVDNEFDSIFNKIKKIVKRYMLDNYSKQKYCICMTLFTVDHDFSAEDYIKHYRALRDNKDKDNEIEYGTNFLSDFDIDLISMFNE